MLAHNDCVRRYSGGNSSAAPEAGIDRDVTGASLSVKADIMDLRIPSGTVRAHQATAGDLVQPLSQEQQCPRTGRPRPQTKAGPFVSATSSVTQQVCIPSDMMGAIIGRGGSNINEIRHASGSRITIEGPQANSLERVMTISGPLECNRVALHMLYRTLGL